MVKTTIVQFACSNSKQPVDDDTEHVVVVFPTYVTNAEIDNVLEALTVVWGIWLLIYTTLDNL